MHLAIIDKMHCIPLILLLLNPFSALQNDAEANQDEPVVLQKRLNYAEKPILKMVYVLLSSIRVLYVKIK